VLRELKFAIVVLRSNPEHERQLCRPLTKEITSVGTYGRAAHTLCELTFSEGDFDDR
jgi:hypothetical protein